LSNHLGNVLVTISDKKLAVASITDPNLIAYYTADVVTANDYYPFGSQMPGRKYSQPNSTYRYGFNGMEKDDEVKGEGNQLDYKMRIYDPRLGRFLSVDPIADEYPSLTPYQFASNQPIESIDIDGLERLDYRLTFPDGTAKLDLVSTGETKEFMAGPFGGKFMSRTIDIPKHYRVEYNGQHYLFASGGQSSDYVKNMPPAASVHGEYSNAVYSVAELWAFQSDPASFLKTHKSSEQVTADWDDALAKAELAEDIAEAFADGASRGRGGRGKIPRIRTPKPRTSTIKPAIQQKVATTPNTTVQQKVSVQQKAITHYQPTGSMVGKRIGHTFSKHGRHNTKQLTNEAVNGKKEVGQFLDESAAEKIIGDNLGNLKNGAINVPIPSGVGRVIMPNGSFKPATQMRIVPSGSGVSTAYPIL
jgi:RHS repeat-associated protein